jgi:hypothetical protein
MISRKRRLQYAIGLALGVHFLRLCFRPVQPLNTRIDNYSSATFQPVGHVHTDNRAQPLGTSSLNHLEENSHVLAVKQAQSLGIVSSTTPKSDNWKTLPLQFKKSESGCWRQCEHRRNKIVYDWHAAGLDDRGFLFQGLSDLAGYLCAVLVVPRPTFLLHRRHNDNRKMNISATWNDFFNITFRQDGSPSIVDLVNPQNISKRPDPIEIYGGDDFKQWYVLASKNRVSNVVDDFLQLEDYSFRQPPDATAGFVWILQRSYYDMRRSFSKSKGLVVSRRVNASLPLGSVNNRELPPSEMLPLSLSGCTYQQKVAPLYVQNLAREMFKHIQEQAGPSPVVGSFHIRRGDAKFQCNTKLKRMQSYLQCSLNGTETRNITLLFRSDERDQTYRNAIQTMVHDLGHIFIDLDALIISFLKAAVKEDGGAELRLSNYYVYALSQELITKVSFHLKQHRKDSCDDCNKLADQADLWK